MPLLETQDVPNQTCHLSQLAPSAAVSGPATFPGLQPWSLDDFFHSLLFPPKIPFPCLYTSHASAWDPPNLSSPVNPWVTDSSFSLESTPGQKCEFSCLLHAEHHGEQKTQPTTSEGLTFNWERQEKHGEFCRCARLSAKMSTGGDEH